MAIVVESSIVPFLKDKAKQLNVQNEKTLREAIEKYQQEFIEILRECVSNIERAEGGSFLDYIIPGEITIKSNGEFLCGITFDREEVTRPSIFYNYTGKTVYMPYIVNNSWYYGRSWYGEDRHGNLIKTVQFWPYPEHQHFMQRAIDLFNTKNAKDNIIATANSAYE